MNKDFKIGNKVRVKSFDWYNKNKDEEGLIKSGSYQFEPWMIQYCGSVFTITDTIGGNNSGFSLGFILDKNRKVAFTEDWLEPYVCGLDLESLDKSLDD